MPKYYDFKVAGYYLYSKFARLLIFLFRPYLDIETSQL